MKLTIPSLAFAILCSSFPLHASLLRTSVTGFLVFSGNPVNYFDSANSFVPPSGYLNSTGGTTVVIQNPATEFGAVFPSNTDTADFNASQLTITDLTTGTGVDSPFTMTFVDTAFGGLTLSKMSDSFVGGVNGSLAGNLVTVSWGGGGVTLGQTFTAVFNLSDGTAATPEPASWSLLLVSLLVGLGLMSRRPSGSSATRL